MKSFSQALWGTTACQRHALNSYLHPRRSQGASLGRVRVRWLLWAALGLATLSGCGLLVPEHRSSPGPAPAHHPARQQADAEHFQQDLREYWNHASGKLPALEHPVPQASQALLWVVRLGGRGGAGMAHPLGEGHRLAAEAAVSSFSLLGFGGKDQPPHQLSLQPSIEQTPLAVEQFR